MVAAPIYRRRPIGIWRAELQNNGIFRKPPFIETIWSGDLNPVTPKINSRLTDNFYLVFTN